MLALEGYLVPTKRGERGGFMSITKEIIMFKMFQKLLDKGSYFAAGDILSALGSMIRIASEHVPAGFYNAQLRVVPLDDCLHIFMVFENLEDFNALPGDLAEVEYRGPIRLISKAVQLSELFAPEYSRGVILHFLHTSEVSRIRIVGDSVEVSGAPS